MPSRPLCWNVLLTMNTVRAEVLELSTNSSAYAPGSREPVPSGSLLSPSKRTAGRLFPPRAPGTRVGCLFGSLCEKSFPAGPWSAQSVTADPLSVTPFAASRWYSRLEPDPVSMKPPGAVPPVSATFVIA